MELSKFAACEANQHVNLLAPVAGNRASTIVKRGFGFCGLPFLRRTCLPAAAQRGKRLTHLRAMVTAADSRWLVRARLEGGVSEGVSQRACPLPASAAFSTTLFGVA